MSVRAVIVVSIALQVGAAVLALRFGRAGKYAWAWRLAAAGMALAVLRRIVRLALAAPPDLAAELDVLVGSAVAVALLGALAWTRRSEAAREAAGRAREERLQLAVDGAELGLWDRDVRTGRLTVSDRWARMLGYEPTEVEPRFEAWRSLVHPSDAGDVLRRLDDHLAGRTPFYESEHRMRTKSGEWKWVLARGKVAERGPDGAPLRIAGTHVDIAERKRSEAEYRLLFEKMMSGFALHELICDANGTPCDYRFLRVNPAFERLTGLKAAEIVGRTVREAIPGIESYWIETYGKVALTGEPAHFEHYSAELGRHYEVTAFSPEKGRFATFFLDATDRRRAEEERRELQARVVRAQKFESLGVLAGGIAHEFNNLLMGILGNADLALDDIPPASTAHSCVRGIQASSRRAADVCRQMLAYSGRGRFAIEPIDLNRLVRDMTRLLELSIPKTTVVRYEFGEPLPGIEGDAAQIRQVLVNLMTNAAEAIGERGGVISLRTGAAECGPEDLHDTGADAVLCPGIYVYLEVTDTGTGMDEETRQKIFDPFFSTKFVGRGLGLPAAIGIARGHKGGIRVWSEPGKGSTFRVLFPAREEGAADSAGPDAGPARWRGSGTVLLVDDDETVRTVAKAMLRRMGFDVLTAGTGREALDVFGRCRDATVCVVLDLTMPQMDGEATFRELRRMKPDVPVVLSSGHDETDVLNRFAGLNLSGFIQKPYTSALLEEKLRGALGQPASGTALQTRKPDPRAGASDGPCGSC